MRAVRSGTGRLAAHLLVGVVVLAACGPRDASPGAERASGSDPGGSATGVEVTPVPLPVARAVGTAPVGIAVGAVSVDVPTLTLGPDDRVLLPLGSDAAWVQPGPAPGDVGLALLLLRDGADLGADLANDRIVRSSIVLTLADGTTSVWVADLEASAFIIDYGGSAPPVRALLVDGVPVSYRRDEPRLAVVIGRRVLLLAPAAPLALDLPDAAGPAPVTLASDGVELPVVATPLLLDAFPLPPSDAVGWLRPGPAPGDPAPALLTVPAGSSLGTRLLDPAVLAKGVDVRTADGSATRWAVAAGWEGVPWPSGASARMFYDAMLPNELRREGRAVLLLLLTDPAGDRLVLLTTA